MDELLSRRRAVVGLVIGALGAGALFWALPGNAGAGPGPPGNNGTVKIDGEEFDPHPDNEPHVGCVFQVDFYGYDEGDPNADVTFHVWPATRGMVTVLEDTVFIGQDDNSGGGSEAGLDAEATYDLTAWLADSQPHPQQGWHVKLTVNADGSQGADVKHKRFWGSGCEAPSPTTTTAGPTTTTEATTTTTASSTTTESPATTDSTTTTVPTSTTTEEPPTTLPTPTPTTTAPTTTVPTTTTTSP
jgi:hypothetical protein